MILRTKTQKITTRLNLRRVKRTTGSVYNLEGNVRTGRIPTGTRGSAVSGRGSTGIATMDRTKVTLNRTRPNHLRGGVLIVEIPNAK